MAATLIEIPDELKDLGGAIADFVSVVRRAVDRGGDCRGPVDFSKVQDALAESSAHIESQANRAVLSSYDIDCETIFINGALHRRVGRYSGDYHTMSGTVPVERSLYRPADERNGKTVDVVSLRSGARDGWLPRTAEAMAFLLAQGTSREAEQTARRVQRRPYSRCSFERCGHDVGNLCLSRLDEVHLALARDVRVPKGVRSVSVAIDRAAVPMSEVDERRPDVVHRAFRMAYCGTVALHDKKGKALRTYRYGEMPHGDVWEMLSRMRADLGAVFDQKPRLPLVQLADGAEELWRLFRIGFAEHYFPQRRGATVGTVDFWHLVEKLGAADEMTQRHAGQHRNKRLDKWKLSLLNSPTAMKRILRELRTSGCVDKRTTHGTPVKDAIRYIENHSDRMDYAKWRSAGFPIGSGNVEATCKSLVGLRMKRPGSRWKPQTAQEVLQLRAHAISGRWEKAMKVVQRPKRLKIQIAA